MAHGAPTKRKNVQDNNIKDNNIDIDEFAGRRDGGWGWIVVIASFLIHIISKWNIYVNSSTFFISVYSCQTVKTVLSIFQ